MTAVSRPTPASCSAMCKAAVPFTAATAREAPVNAVMASSKRLTKLPTDEIQPVSRHSLTYLHSLPDRFGIESGIMRGAGMGEGDSALRASLGFRARS